MFPTFASVNATTDLTQLFVYWNTVTNGKAMPMVLFSFFAILFIGSYFAQLRFQGYAKVQLSFVAAAFATVGMAVIMSLQNGLLNTSWLIVSIVIAVIGFAWLVFSAD